MGKLSLALASILVLLSFQTANSSELTFEFGSPSFSGNGKSSHYLTIENIEKTRKDAIKAPEKAAKEKAENDATTTAIAKFNSNIERKESKNNIFATIGSVVQLDRISDFGSDGWGFESLRGHYSV